MLVQLFTASGMLAISTVIVDLAMTTLMVCRRHQQWDHPKLTMNFQPERMQYAQAKVEDVLVGISA